MNCSITNTSGQQMSRNKQSSAKPARGRRLLSVVAAIAALALPSLAQAAPLYWNTGDGVWSNGANWSNNAVSGGTTGTVPAAGSPGTEAFFNQSSVNGNQIVTLTGNQSTSSLVFNNTGTTQIKSSGGTRTLTLGGNGGDHANINAGAGNVTLGDAIDNITLVLNNTNSGGNVFRVTSGATLNVPANIILGNTGAGSAKILQVRGDGTVKFDGVLSTNAGAGFGQLVVGSLTAPSPLEAGSPTVYLNQSNTFLGGTSGTTYITIGTVYLGATSTGPAGAPTSSPLGGGGSPNNFVNIFGNTTGASQVNGPVNLLTSASNLTIANNIRFAGASTAAAMTTIGGNTATNSIYSGTMVMNNNAVTLAQVAGGSTSFTGILSGPAASGLNIGKAGFEGTVVLTAANTYTGGTNVNAGLLLANNTTGSATGNGAVTVNSGGTLGGTGAVSGAVTILGGGTLAPGASIESLAVGSLTLASSSSKLAVEIDLTIPDADLLTVTGGVSLGGSILDITLLNPTLINLPGTYMIVQNDLGDAVSGTFGSIVIPFGYAATVDTAFSGTDSIGRTGTGNDIAVTITAVPEPGTLALLPLAGLLPLGRRRGFPRRVKRS